MAFQLEGQFLLHLPGVPVSTTFLSVTCVLWCGSHEQHCPRIIPFGIGFPLTFDDGGQARALPPTFESIGSHSACAYSLTIELSRPRQFLAFLKGSEAWVM